MYQNKTQGFGVTVSFEEKIDSALNWSPDALPSGIKALPASICELCKFKNQNQTRTLWLQPIFHSLISKVFYGLGYLAAS